MYRALGDGSVSGTVLSFTDNTQTTFDVLGLLSPAPAVGDYVVVYNLGPNFDPSNAYLYGNAKCGTAGQGCNIAKISAVGTGNISLSSNPFANEGPPLPSPNNRFQIVPNAGPVTYTCSPSAGAAVNRYSGYSGSGASAWSLNQPTSFVVAPAVVLDNATCDVDYAQQNALARSGLLFIRINVTDAASGDVVTVFREIHVDNSP
jgi:MSHA biogenesis protein MshO